VKSKIGLVLCIIYALFTAACLYGAYSSSGDDKGWVLMMQLPLILVSSILNVFGLEERMLENLSWTAGYALFVPITFALLYIVGYLMEFTFRSLNIKA
jgi:hypothetical protein